eukprot:4466863-Pleurochrysis_carterae.AAC.4
MAASSAARTQCRWAVGTAKAAGGRCLFCSTILIASVLCGRNSMTQIVGGRLDRQLLRRRNVFISCVYPCRLRQYHACA